MDRMESIRRTLIGISNLSRDRSTDMAKSKALVKTSDLNEDKIYILTALNKHNQKVTIATDTSMPASLKAREDFLIKNTSNRYWLQKDGKLDTKIEIKSVKNNII